MSYLDDEKEILEFNDIVENKVSADKSDITPFKKWYINKIEFSNFLIFGDNQVLDFNKVKGITAVESNPPNFGGKTVLTVDLLLFLFFNTTTKQIRLKRYSIGLEIRIKLVLKEILLLMVKTTYSS